MIPQNSVLAKNKTYHSINVELYLNNISPALLTSGVFSVDDRSTSLSVTASSGATKKESIGKINENNIWLL